MLPRRFALIRHVDYTGAAGTGVIAYGVAFDDGQVVLRWSSAHRATSVLDSVEDLIAAHGHGETTSIEWIDAPPGKSDAPAQPGGRRARRTSPLDDSQPAAEVPQIPTPPEAVPAEPTDVRPAAQEQQEPAPAAESADVRPAAHVERTPAPTGTTARPAAHAPPFDEPVAAPAPQGPQAPAPSPVDAGHTTGPVPASPPAFAQPAGAAQPPAPPVVPSPSPNGAPSPPPARPVPEIPAPGARPAQTPPPPWSNGAMRSSSSTEPADAAVSSSAAPPPARAPERPDTARGDNNGERRSHDHGAAVIDAATGQGTDDQRRARHEAIATQPMNADFSEDRGQRRPRRAADPPSPRSIFEEAEEPARPDLRLASSNGRSREPDDSDDSEDTSPGREDFGGYFSPGHQHLDTVTGLLDLPAGLDKRGRGSGAEQDAIGSRRNGRHRGE